MAMTWVFNFIELKRKLMQRLGLSKNRELYHKLHETDWLKDYDLKTIEQAFSKLGDEPLKRLELKYRIYKACQEVLEEEREGE